LYDGSIFDSSELENSITQLTNTKADKEVVNNTFATKSELNSKIFIGTQEEYDIAYSAGNVAIGALVIILDNLANSSDTTALLGTAILGKMILGNN
jgi:hypothetical protein